MVKNSPTKNYQKAKKGFEKKFMKGIKIFLKKRKTKSNNMVGNNIKISQKMKNRS